MQETNNRKLVEDYFNAWAKGDSKTLERLLDSSYTFNNPPPGLSSDRRGALEMSRLYHAAFPDMSLKLSNWIVDKDQCAFRFTGTGTHKGEFLGLSPTNKRVEVTGLAIVKCRNGKVVEDITEFDALGLLTKLGAIPELPVSH
jgi:predicted ester cyclase